KVEAKNKQRRYSPDEARTWLPKVELSIREQDAMMKLLEMKMADPANHADPAQSAAMAAEHDEYEPKSMELREKWEQLMEAREG
ncbi:MAG: ABC transporter ATP-binding protein, partial [Phascolarctobacterium sp.]|nr:ABC transporter ATP-binding protein [Phascolarctobacterium sp.]